MVVGQGRNWRIPFFMPVLLRYVSGPILAIIFSFAYPEFYTLRYDPLMIAGFILAHMGLLMILLGFVMPRYYDAFVPPERRGEGTGRTIAGVPKEPDAAPTHHVPSGDDSGDAISREEKAVAKEERSPDGGRRHTDGVAAVH